MIKSQQFAQVLEKEGEGRGGSGGGTILKEGDKAKDPDAARLTVAFVASTRIWPTFPSVEMTTDWARGRSRMDCWCCERQRMSASKGGEGGM